MGYAGSLSVCPPSRPRGPGGFTRMLSVSPPPSATGIGTASCGPMSPASVCRVIGRASPMAARVDPRHVRARHQSLHHFVSNAPWDDAAVLRVARDCVLDQMERHGAVAAGTVEDTGIPKKGRHSVGVTRQYCGVLGKQDNCQVVVTVTLANEAVSIPGACRLYLPEVWARDRRRRRTAGVPDELSFETKWQIALKQIDELRREGVPVAPVLADAGDSATTAFREGLGELALPHVVGVTK